MKYNPDIHHRRSTRLRYFDYSSNNAYFITICTKDRECILSKVVGAPLAGAQIGYDAIREQGHSSLQLSSFGSIADQNWLSIPKRYTQVLLDEYIIMPNHFHGIIVIDRAVTNFSPKSNRAPARGTPTLGQIIGGFKSCCVVDCLKYIRKQKICNGESFKSGKIWQRSFYDRVIRNENELNKIREYIVYNPKEWENDENNPLNFEATKTRHAQKIYK